MAEQKRLPPTSVDNIVINTLYDLHWPVRMELGLVKNVLYGYINNFMQYDPRDVVPREEIYKELCKAFEKIGYKHHIEGRREYWERPVNNFKRPKI